MRYVPHFPSPKEGVPMTKDMTAGSPMKLVLGFAVPLMFGNLFQ